jgi:hypothetical protein
METLFVNEVDKPDFEWHLKVQAEGEGDQRPDSHAPGQIIKFEVKNNAGRWKADATVIEAAISLWMYHIHRLEVRSGAQDNKSGGNIDPDWLQQNLELRRRLSGSWAQIPMISREIGGGGSMMVSVVQAGKKETLRTQIQCISSRAL